jgi:hypothetical protein
MLDEKPNDTSEYADHISVISNDGRTGAATQDGLFNRRSKEHGTPDDSVPGFIGTGKKLAQTESFTYKSKEYLTPDGYNLTIACHDQPWATADNFIACQYGYKIDKSLAISTGFVTKVVP